ncbi:hypothetical protein ABBQ32_006406 [Trebouxia sp. C0010 RCD-2024]
MDRRWTEDDEKSAFDDLLSARAPSRGALSNVLEDYELKSLQSEHAAEQYAVHHETSKRTPAGWKDPKQKIQAEISQTVHHVQDAFNVLKERGVLHQTEYAANIPAAVHGAPKTAEESKESLERLRRMGAFEAQDFDNTDNDVERETTLNRDHLDYLVEESWRWLLSFLIGVSMGLLAFLVDIVLQRLNSFKFGAVRSVVSNHGGFWAPYMVWLCFTMGYAALSAYLVTSFAPLGAGSGIPEIKTYLNGVHIKGLLGLKTLVVKMFSVTLSMAGGLIAGKEGPFIHAGGIVGGGWASMGSRTVTELLQRFGYKKEAKVPHKYGGYFRNDADHRDFVGIGTAAGVSCSFAAPIGGLLLSIEEGASFYSTSLFWRGFLATCTGVCTLHFLAQFHEKPSEIFDARFGIRRDLGLYDDSIALYGSRFWYYIWELPIYVIVGCVAGALGGIFIKLNIHFTAFRAKYIPSSNRWRRFGEVVFVAWLVATAWFLVTYHSPCQPLPSKEQLSYYESSGEDQDIYAGVSGFDSRGLKFFPQLWCKSTEFNPNGQLFFNPLVQSMRMIVHFGETLPEKITPEHIIGSGLLFIWALCIFCGMLFCFGIGAATGLFIPSLALGASWGRIIGMFVRYAVGPHVAISLPAYAAVGAAAQLGGVTRMTLSITVLVMEGTGALQLVVPMMLAVFMAKIVGDAVGMGVYDLHIKIRGAPVLLEAALESHQRMVSDKLSVGELMTTQMTALEPIMLVSKLETVLKRCAHQAFPITSEVEKAFAANDSFPLHGVIKRTQVLRMLKHRIGLFVHDGMSPWPPASARIPRSQEERIELLDKLEQFPLKIRAKEEQESILRGLTDDERHMYIDLRPFMQRTPFLVHANASLSRTYRLFRTMGLHHVFVGPPKPMVMGVITRKDVTEENAELALGMKANKGLIPAAATPTGGGIKDVPFFPYAPYTPQTEMSVTGASFSQKRVQLPPVMEENQHNEGEETVDDNEMMAEFWS